jgi:hypothetical protein
MDSRGRLSPQNLFCKLLYGRRSICLRGGNAGMVGCAFFEFEIAKLFYES